ncbi:heavy metal translocating P-type ATPase, partial [Lysinibacillus agricola]
ESQSNHPLAQASTSDTKVEGRKKFPQATIEDIPCWGIKGYVDHIEYQVGKPDFVCAEEAENFADGVATKLAAEGKTVI